MINKLANLNWFGVLAAFVPYFLLGALWFTLLFAKPYKISLGRGDENLQNNKPIFIVGPALCSLLITVTNAILIYALDIRSFGGALEFSAIVGVGYLFANTVNIAINPNIPRPILYGLITGTYHLLGISIANVILVAMK